MPHPTIEKLMRVLYRDGVVYDIDTDSLIRDCASSMSALALFDVPKRPVTGTHIPRADF